MQWKIKSSVFIISLWLISCKEEVKSDAYGNFEAIEVIVSTESNGKLLNFKLEEGDILNTNDTVGYIDPTQLNFQQQQLTASIQALKAQVQNIQTQLDVLYEQRKNILREKARIEALLKDDAATKKQWDDINGELQVVEKRIVATKEQLQTANNAVLAQINPIKEQIKSVQDKLAKSIVINPIKGEVLTKYVEEDEVVSYGRPLYSIADLSEMILRIYVSGEQLPYLHLGQQVQVLIDKSETENRSLQGRVSWVSSRAEFTPKIIQTKKERVSMVYAVKVIVKNDGSLKIGMPGEVNFLTPQQRESLE